MKSFYRIFFLLIFAVLTQTKGIAQSTFPTNYCPWLGADTVRYHQAKVCSGTVLHTGREGVYFSGYTYKWDNGSTNHWFTFTSAGLYWVEITKDACTIRDSLEIIYVTPPKVNLGNDTTLCFGDSLVLDAGNPGASYEWNGNFNTPNQTQTFVVKNEGKYRVRVAVPGCVTNDTIEVKFKSPSTLSLGADKLLCEGDSILLNPGIMNAKYLWQDRSTKPYFIVTRPGTYSVRIDDACGSFSDTIKFTGSNCKLYIPNAFTPNNDGKNDLFKVVGYDNLSFFRFTVYNRWGAELFSSSLPERGWDGTLKGNFQPAGVYVWVLKYKKKYKPESILQSGTVLLIR